mmetsp:Transcript_36534/g.60512  ORF Transcript_36534/g.60512 Transcript_36534/m.60512 type:complete len:191 (+) Transcript_36534:118-690(+)|eukprot:CAMPEP_0119325870 /NCGR_PEP_ID=MMETSP1333-20130426/66896_1 /TAXON_ID=418940 /ORGANISM="Scyphosphaera apsteinii, Strain RCC1455" /LENGTH=190 /DNA_ID=CAMNT_0007334007 /DNA_START=124 /DNA_END=696 /DNA_ORIENTATION=-
MSDTVGLVTENPASGEKTVGKKSEWERKLCHMGSAIVNPLPEYWHRKRDEHGRKFYYNSVTYAVTYERPSPLPNGWKEARDPATNVLYFWNVYTRKTLPWDTPPGGVIVPQPAPVAPPNISSSEWPQTTSSRSSLRSSYGNFTVSSDATRSRRVSSDATPIISTYGCNVEFLDENMAGLLEGSSDTKLHI